MSALKVKAKYASLKAAKAGGWRVVCHMREPKDWVHWGATILNDSRGILEWVQSDDAEYFKVRMARDAALAWINEWEANAGGVAE